MKITLDLDGQLLTEAKRRAAASGLSLRAFVEDALRLRLLPAPAVRRPFHLELPVVRGSAPPAVEVMERRALPDFMDRRE